MILSPEQENRYARHLCLREVGPTGQQKLLDGRVLVVGAGALGSAALYYLAAAGVGTLGAADGDEVDRSNLQRQILHGEDRLGMNKAVSSQLSLARLNTDVRVRVYPHYLTPDNILDTLQDYDFIIDATDRFPAKFLLNDACVLARKPYAHAGIVGFGGQAMTYVPGQGPCLRCLMETVPRHAPTSAEVGVLGACVGVLGSIQATEAIKYLLGAGELLTGRILQFDGLGMTFRVSRMRPSPTCKLCGPAGARWTLQAHRSDYEETE